MEQYIQISKINDFLYSPASVYLHSIYEDFNGNVYKTEKQIVGLLNHQNIDQGKYSTRKDILSGLAVYSDKYKIMGKIDIYDRRNGFLIERKTRIKKIHQGYKYQLYGQYLCLKEMGENPKKLFLQSLEDNKRYITDIPNRKQIKEFESLIKKMTNFKAEDLLKERSDYLSRISIYSPISW